jgi:hypothetical protein
MPSPAVGIFLARVGQVKPTGTETLGELEAFLDERLDDLLLSCRLFAGWRSSCRSRSELVWRQTCTSR